jgi:hypothetical protein
MHCRAAVVQVRLATYLVDFRHLALAGTERGEDAQFQDALAAALLCPVALAGVQQIAQRDDADQFARVIAPDDGELGQAGLGHPVDDDTERFVRISDDGVRLD